MQLSSLVKLFLVGISFYSSASLATWAGCASTYYVAASFPAFFQGKEVMNVHVHAGVQEATETFGNQPAKTYWDPFSIINFQEMTKVGDHFFTKYKTNGQRGGGSGGPRIENQGPVIQYWVEFKDAPGQSFIDEVRAVPVSAYYGYSQPEAQQKAIEEFNKLTNAFTTYAVETHGGQSCPH
jgi:hypothetical protein